MLEFFAGSGLVAYGMKGRFSPVWSNDIDGRKAAVYRANFKSDHFVQADIRNITGASLPCAHLSWASFPCQDLSLAGNMKGIYAERSGLVWEWLRVMYEMKERPKILALENVTGLLSADGGANYISLHNALAERGYRCGAMEINADLFVPQSRPRIFVIAVRKDVPVPERMVSGGPNWLHNNAAQKLGNQLDGWIWWNAEKPAARKAELKDILEPDAVFDKDGALKLIPERMMKELNSRDNAVAAGYRRTRREGQRLELRFDGLAGCLRTPSGGSSKQYIVVRRNGTNHARLLTARETARLMGAPDSYSLPGSYNDAYFAMGDAVALPVANFLSEKFLMPLTEAAYHD
ncbi:DNA (cytosine-5-)-methyltransferase [bacterium]|nr:DNA (cytosine-5-)-methyltransferase [bacterium]